MLWMDEAHFILTGNVNSKNFVHWAEENHHGVASVPFYDTCVTVWCGVAETFILGPYFLEDVTCSGIQTCSITGDRYKPMLENYIITESQQRNVINDIVWLQDGAPPHIATSITQVLQQHFGYKLIARNFAVSWPHQNQNLDPIT